MAKRELQVQPPLVAGGQGRSSDDVIGDGSVFFTILALGAVLLLGVVSFG